MKKQIFILALLLTGTIYDTIAQPSPRAKQDISYRYEQSKGANASAVAWNPDLKIYFCLIAGNTGFPLEGFSSSGNNVFSTTTGFDCRGMWYNPATSKMEINGLAEKGWISFGMNERNNPDERTVLFEGKHQPDDQSAGAYDPVKKKVIFFDPATNKLAMYSRSKPKKPKMLSLDLNGTSPSSINWTSVGYTGHDGYEFVLLDFSAGRLLFYNRKGKQTATCQLPSDAPLNETFAFSFTNDRAFLYDKDGRTWYGYKVF